MNLQHITFVFAFASFLPQLPLNGQASGSATYRAQLASDDPQTRLGAIKQLETLGPTAKSEAPTLEKLLRDADFNVRFEAALALPKIVGPTQAAKTFDSLARDTTAAKGRSIALTGLEQCGALGLPTVAWTLKNGDEPMKTAALVTASKIDTEGTLYSDVLQLLLDQPAPVAHAARKYVLAHGMRRFFAEQGRWPNDFIEAEAYIRKSNPLLTLAPLTKDVQIRFEPEPDGSIKVRTYAPQPGGTFKTGHYYVLQKPLKK